MRRPRKPSILALGVTAATATAILGATPVSAEVGLSVSPALLELSQRDGDTGRVELTVRNSGTEAFDIVTSLTTLADMTGRRSAVEWSAISPRRVTLEPGERLVAELTIDVPEDADSGGRYQTVNFATVPPGRDDSTGVAGRIAVPVFVTVAGQGALARDPELERTALFLEADGRLGARVDVSNDGNVHVPLLGEVTVAPKGSPDEDRLDIQMGRVLPGVTRTYAPGKTLDAPLDATYDVNVTMAPPDSDGEMGRPSFEESFEVAAEASLEIADLIVCTDAADSLTVTAPLVNEGTLGLVTKVIFELASDAGDGVGQVTAPGQPLVWPGEVEDVSATIVEPLPAGEYTLVARALFGADRSVEASTPLSVAEESPLPSCAPGTASSTGTG